MCNACLAPKYAPLDWSGYLERGGVAFVNEPFCNGVCMNYKYYGTLLEAVRRPLPPVFRVGEGRRVAGAGGRAAALCCGAQAEGAQGWLRGDGRPARRWGGRRRARPNRARPAAACAHPLPPRPPPRPARQDGTSPCTNCADMTGCGLCKLGSFKSPDTLAMFRCAPGGGGASPGRSLQHLRGAACSLLRRAQARAAGVSAAPLGASAPAGIQPRRC